MAGLISVMLQILNKNLYQFTAMFFVSLYKNIFEYQYYRTAIKMLF